MKNLLAALCVATGALAAAQEPATPRLETASIKRNAAGANAPGGMNPRPGGYSAVNVPLALLIPLAYDFHGSEIVGAPDWFYEDAYDVEVRFSGPPTPEQSRALWRELFTDRLKLAAHVETREQPAYALALARSDGRLGSAITRIDTDCAAHEAARLKGERPEAPRAANGALLCETRVVRTGVISGGTSMAAFARAIQPTTGRVVVDRTGLTGSYELTLTFAPRRPGVTVDAPRADEPPTVFTALPDQLGLTLEPIRAPVRVLVIDRIERPSQN